MLVLSRKSGEQVVIDGGIVVTVTEVIGGRVKLGIDAPKHVVIMRGELVEDQEVTAFRKQWREADRAKPQPASSAGAEPEATAIDSMGSALPCD